MRVRAHHLCSLLAPRSGTAAALPPSSGEVITALMVTLSSFLLLVVRRSRWDILVREKKTSDISPEKRVLINLDRFPA